ncbi:MAG: 50S ribosomal protein L10 [bacterium]
MPTAEKIAKVEEITRKINEAKSVFLTDFSGLNVQEINTLRRSFNEASVQFQVVKNTLARLSVKSAGRGELLDFLEGPTALAFGMDDPAAPARVIKEFSKIKDAVKIKACLFDGELISADRTNDIANLPTKEVLLARLMSGINSPLSNLVFSLNGVFNKLVLVLDAVRKQKEAKE